MSSVLIIGGGDPVGAQLASRLQRLGHEVAATVSPTQGSDEVTQALSHRGIEVYRCDPSDPLALSAAVAGRAELYLCLQPELPPPLIGSAQLNPTGWRGVGRTFGELLLSLSGPRGDLNADPFRAHERHQAGELAQPKSLLSVALEASARSSSQLPHVTLLCSMFALAPQPAPLDQLRSERPPALYQPPQLPELTARQRLSAQLKSLLLPELSAAAPPPSWELTHQALKEARALSLPLIFYGLPYHQRQLLSQCGPVELLSWLRPSLASCVSLEDLVTGLIQLRALTLRAQDKPEVWYLGGDNLRVALLEGALNLELSPLQRASLKPVHRHEPSVELGWTLSSAQARAAVGYEWRLRDAVTDERPRSGA